MQAGALDPYEALGVQRDASSAEIKRAYQALALKLHPDKQPDEGGGAAGSGSGSSVGDAAALTFQQLQASWETLRDAESRRAYVRPRSHLPIYPHRHYSPAAPLSLCTALSSRYSGTHPFPVFAGRMKATDWELKPPRLT